MRDFRLYVILDVDICAGKNIIKLARQSLKAGAEILQLRAKGLTDRKLILLGKAIKRLTRKFKAQFILNDRADLARLINADGLHLGQDDITVKEARKILGSKKLIGVSTHNLVQAIKAERDGADYLAIGPIFPTALKPKLAPLSPKVITSLRRKTKIPFVAVGGISLNNLDQVLSAGAQRVALCRAIICSGEIYTITKEFRKRLYLRT